MPLGRSQLFGIHNCATQWWTRQLWQEPHPRRVLPAEVRHRLRHTRGASEVCERQYRQQFLMRVGWQSWLLGQHIHLQEVLRYGQGQEWREQDVGGQDLLERVCELRHMLVRGAEELHWQLGEMWRRLQGEV